jgi:hypothetical protein
MKMRIPSDLLILHLVYFVEDVNNEASSGQMSDYTQLSSQLPSSGTPSYGIPPIQHQEQKLTLNNAVLTGQTVPFLQGQSGNADSPHIEGQVLEIMKSE